MRNHYCFLFLRVLRCFTSPSIALKPYFIQTPVMAHYRQRVSPFRNLRIKGCMLLPEAYRSLPRLSSPADAKASTVCSYALDLKSDHLISEVILQSLYSCQRSIRSEEQGLTPAYADSNPWSPFSTICARFPNHSPAVFTPKQHWLSSRNVSEGWWACLESNQGPHPYQGCALTD